MFNGARTTARGRRTKRPRAFTLIEIVAVLAIMSMLMATAIVSFRGACRSARAQYALETIAQADAVTRERAARFGRTAELEIDIDRSVLVTTTMDDEGETFNQPTPLTGVAIERVMVGNRQRGSGRVAVPFSAIGTSPTYAMRVKGANGESRWLMFCGATGQETIFENDRDIETLLAQVLPRGTDAD